MRSCYPALTELSLTIHSRYSLLHQRTARHDLFSGQSLAGGASRYQLKTVEYLLGTTNRLDDVIVLGMITQMSHGTYHLGKMTSRHNSTYL